jgi:hypothetical protein
MSSVATSKESRSGDVRPGNGAGKLRLLTRDALDGRTRAAQLFGEIVDGIADDLGGADNLTTIQRHLVEAFAGEAVRVSHNNTTLMLGKTIDPAMHAQAVSNLVRLASRLGVERRARDITPEVRERELEEAGLA